MKTKILYILIFYLLVGFSKLNAQSTEIKPGIVLPQMTTAQRTSLSATNGMLVFDTNTQSYWFRENGSWTELPKNGSTTNFWQQNGAGGNEIKNTNSGGFWSANPVGLNFGSNDITNPPTAPVSGAGTRMMWIPSRSAFRVGTVTNDAWDANNIGLFSFASGFNSKASGNYSTAMGWSIANGIASTATGVSVANGRNSTAMGQSTANGIASTAMGSSYANGDFSTATGISIASGTESTAMGISNATGDYSTAMGYRASTNFKTRSFAIGGHSSNASPQVANTTDYQMMMAFHNYRFWTENTGTYVDFGPNGQVTATGAYNNVSDVRLKKDFKPIRYSLSKLNQVKGYNYYWKTDSTSKDLQTGVIAQELREVFPELVHEDDKGMLSVNYMGLIPHLVEAIKDQSRQIEALNKDNIELRTKLVQLLELSELQSKAALKKQTK
jgi:hypothetical protein